MLAHIIAVGLGYLIGSFPSAYLIVKWRANVDIRKAGSGNVGTLNSFEVTNSKLVGVLVLFLDLLKGVAAVLIAQGVIGSAFTILGSAGVGAVLGHNFPIWLKFKGGRGLATAAGVMLVLGWWFILLWGVVWFLGKHVSKDVNVGNAIATLALLASVWLLPADVVQKMSHATASASLFSIFATVLMAIILVRLVEPVRDYFSAPAKERGLKP